MSWFQNFAALASGIVSIATLALIIVLLPVVFSLRKAVQRMADTLERAERDARPLIEKAGAVVDDVQEITARIREEVDRISDGVESATDQIETILGVTARRLRSFNALLAVAHDEAQSLVLGTASTVRGIARGAKFAGALFRRRKRRPAEEPELVGPDHVARANGEPLPARPRARSRRDRTPTA